MLALVFEGVGKFGLREVPKPAVMKDQVLVRVTASMICGTDLHILTGDFPAANPVILGHEFSGYVVEVGPEVTSLKEGDAVSIEPHVYCGKCKFCRNGKEHLCLDKKGFGVRLNGGFAEYALVPERAAYKVPEGLTMEEAALAENLGCCIHGIDRADIQFGDTVVILGAGFVGIVLALLAKRRGAARVVVVEPVKYRREKALMYGADYILDPTSEDVEGVVKHITEGLGADVVIEAAGRKETAELALRLVGRGGTVLFFGVVPPRECVVLEPNRVFREEISIVGSVINPYSHHKSLQLLSQLNLKDLITHIFPLERAMEAFEVAQKGIGLKVCIRPNTV